MLVAAGCYTGATLDPNAAAPVTSIAGTTPAAATGDLPCDVAALLADACSSCHGDPLSGGAKNRLLDATDLGAPSKLDPSKTTADDCVARMKDPSRPMPPTGQLAADKVALLESWVAAGMPAGTCSSNTSGASPTNTPTVCTSNQQWTRGDRGSQSMHPGVACIDCHSKSDGPLYQVAGTVYPTAHEPDDCYGASGSATVVITDANGTAYSLPVNSAGNFFSRTRIATPYTAKVISGGKTRAMVGAQKNGDCNTCHTEQGTETAPGRIMAP